MTTEVTINYSDQEMLRTLKETIAQALTDSELRLFIEVCRSTGLNPFKREIWCIKVNKSAPVQVMTGINGFFTIANRHPQYDGIHTSTAGEVKLPGGGIAPASATSIVYRKDRKIPMECTAYWSEYGKSHGVWKQYPSIMLIKCAESLALRKSFPQELNGVYTVEEMQTTDPVPGAVNVQPESGAVYVKERETQKNERVVLNENDGHGVVKRPPHSPAVAKLSSKILMAKTMPQLRVVGTEIMDSQQLSASEKEVLRSIYLTTVASLKGG